MNKEDKLTLRTELLNLAMGLQKPYRKDYGICAHIRNMWDNDKIKYDAFQEVNKLMLYWPEGTGNRTFPVPAYPFLRTDFRADFAFRQTSNLWTGLYGKRRKALALWLSQHEDLQ